MKRIRIIGIGICFCFIIIVLFNHNSIVQAAEKKDTAKTYYKHLEELEKKEKQWTEKAITTLELNNVFSEIYKIWGNELNTIYNELKLNLSKEEFEQLQQEQRKWIIYKEKEMEKVKQEWSGGTAETWSVLSTAAAITKKRVYELSEQLFGKNPDSQVQAKSTIKTKLLSEDEIYFYDLDNDGKEEKIKYSVIIDNNNRMEILLYINDKEIYKKKMDYALHAQYTIADIDKTDGYLDLFLMVTSDSYSLEYSAFQQYQSNQIKTLTSSLSNKSLQFIRGYEIEKVDGKGSFKGVIDTPFYLQVIGNYNCYVPFVMEDGKIKQKQVNTYSFVSSSKDFKYVLEQEIKVYKKANISSKLLRTIKKGEYITISKIKLSTNNDALKENVSISTYAYIQDKNGKKGWIYLDKDYNEDNPLFKEIPVWG